MENNYSKGIINATNKPNNNGGIIMNKNMTMEEFSSAIKETVNNILGKDYEVKVQQVLKNNNTHLTGLVIKAPENPIAPTVYLEQFLEEYTQGHFDIAAISDQIINIYDHSIVRVNFDVESVADLSACKEKICYKLVNAKKNKELLEEVPHVLMNDLAIIFFIYFGEETSFGTASITIKNQMLSSWNITTYELLEIAKHNTKRLFPANIRPMSNVLFGIMNKTFGDDELNNAGTMSKGLDTIYVCSNASDLWGAGVILYDGILADMAGKLESDYIYVLPSSVHETILIPSNGMDTLFLKTMVSEVNSTAVAPEEVLSDNVYVFNAETETIDLA